MKRLADRRRAWLAATAAVTVVAGMASGQTADIRGTIEFAGGAPIPKGQIRVYVDDPAASAAGREPAAQARMDSSGKSRTIEFSLPPPASPPSSATAEIVAQLERADGWLLARGSAEYDADSPVTITLYTVMY